MSSLRTTTCDDLIVPSVPIDHQRKLTKKIPFVISVRSNCWKMSKYVFLYKIFITRLKQ